MLMDKNIVVDLLYLRNKINNFNASKLLDGTMQHEMRHFMFALTAAVRKVQDIGQRQVVYNISRTAAVLQLILCTLRRRMTS